MAFDCNLVECLYLSQRVFTNLQNLTYEKSKLVQVMAWCRQATSHYLSQCWPRSMSPYGVIKLQLVNSPVLLMHGKQLCTQAYLTKFFFRKTDATFLCPHSGNFPTEIFVLNPSPGPAGGSNQHYVFWGQSFTVIGTIVDIISQPLISI